MEETIATTMIKQKIDQLIDGILPLGDGIISEHRLRWALQQAAEAGFIAGQSDALSGLLSVEEAADRIGVSYSRMRVIIRERHERFGIGKKIGERSWVIHERELDSLRPGPEGWPKGTPRGKKQATD